MRHRNDRTQAPPAGHGWPGSAWEAVLRMLYPPCCAACRAITERPDDPLCLRCTRRLERASPEALSERLGRLPDAARTALDGAFALWLFDANGAVQRLHHRLKYGNRPRLGLSLGRLLGSALQDGLPVRPDGLVPIPLHRARLYERGYNQSTQLARGVASVLNRPVYDGVLVRGRATRSQTTLSRLARWQNVAGAFTAPDPPAVAGRTLVLLDDVLTTGATLAAAAIALRRAGAASVHAVTLSLARG